jgi:hypothetical protein
MSESVTLQGYGALRARLERLKAIDKPLLRMLGMAAVREAKERVPRKTANLSRSISSALAGTASVRIYAQANYAGFVEGGTRPHDIVPRQARVLAWPSSSAGRRLSGTARTGMFKSKKSAAKLGGWSYAMRVHHPGTKPHPFLRPGAEAAIEGAGLAKLVVAVWDGKTL